MTFGSVQTALARVLVVRGFHRHRSPEQFLLATCRLNTGEPVLIFSLDLRSTKWQLSVN